MATSALELCKRGRIFVSLGFLCTYLRHVKLEGLAVFPQPVLFLGT
jgi:hypothetical protein